MPPTALLGRSGLEITRVGLGGWAIGGGGYQGSWGPQDDDDSIRTIRHAVVDHGVNWIDTAAAYGLGRSESVVGDALAELRPDERPLVFTKCGLVWGEGETTFSNVLSPASIRRECDASLRRLRVDVLDVYLMHWPTWDATPIEESWATMAQLVDEGKVRAIGLSNFDVDELERCHRVRPVDVVQPELNMINRVAAADRIPWAREHGAGVIVYSPMASGLLTGAFGRDDHEAMAEDDWRRAHANFREPWFSLVLELVERLARIAAPRGCTVAELAIAWTLSWPGVAGAIVGARAPAEVDGWARAADVELSEHDLARIADALAAGDVGTGPLGAAVGAS